MKLLLGEVISGKAQVVGLFYDHSMAPENAIDVDFAEVPEPQLLSRKNPVLYYDSQTNALFYEYINRDLTVEEQLADLQLKIAEKDQVINDISMVLSDIIAGN
ncbi:hypothetical protein [Paenibacillus sp. NPDC058174]|uniref:hypothetical protein n=1 Tax=Paenibacillus sp. NPDC058174 TaxID=3346366 RepID=UPI0036DDD0EC